MLKNLLTGALHQILLMLRDPVIYLAIDEQSGAFAEDEILSIRIAKAKALLTIYHLDDGLQLALQLNDELAEEDCLDLQMLNLLTIIRIYTKKGDYQNQKTYTEEAFIRVKNSENEALKLLVNAANIIFLHRELIDIEERVEEIASAIDRADHPYYRYLLLSWLGAIYSMLSRHDLALNYQSAAYDVCSQHQLSIGSLELCIELVATCARIDKPELAEHFYDLGQRFIAQLRLPIFEVGLHFNYAILKGKEADYKAAALFYQKSLDALQASKQDLPELLFDIYNHLSWVLNHLDLGQEALHYQLKAEKIITGLGYQERQVELSTNIATSLISLDRGDEAIDRLKRAAQFYKKHDKREALIRVTRNIASYYEKREDYLRGFAVMRELDKLNAEYLTHLQQSRSQFSDDKLQEIIRDSREIKAKYDQLVDEISTRQAERFTGKSDAAKRVIDSAVLASMHPDASVLIQGESGTGKEVLARMIHYSSPQKNHPFIPVNCAAISPAHFELEFFGGAAGQLTGLSEDRQGHIEKAGEGTLFINEISALPRDFQAKLLQVIDTKTYTPVGRENALPLLCKIIASTNQDTLQMLGKGKFRLDLLHKLNTLEIVIPPLRQRREDICIFVENFARNFARETNHQLPQIQDSFYKKLNKYDFPGNVRELKNIIERIFILYYKPVWTEDILNNLHAFRQDKTFRSSLVEHKIQDIDKIRIVEALRKSGGKQKDAAKLLNVSESTLSRRIKRYRLK